MSEFIPTEKGVPIRQPSTANLMADSQDRTSGATAADFTISRKNSILNGFFTRIGVTEVVLEWFEPNLNTDESVSFSFTESGGADVLCIIPFGFYTVETLLRQIAISMTAASLAEGQSRTYTSASVIPGSAYITVTGSFTFSIDTVPGFNTIANRLGFSTNVAAKTHFVGEVSTNAGGNGWTPDLRQYRYIDITSSSLTYNQDLKDASTAQSVDNILCRWYFAWPTQPQLDGYGFPILQGYTAFTERRTFNPPKQIKWASNMPIGQIQFRVTWTPPGNSSVPQTLPADTQFDWLMTLQVSEV